MRGRLFLSVLLIAQQLGAFVAPDAVYVTASDTLVLHSRSNWERDTFGNTHNGSPLLTNILSGNGDIKAGQTVTDTGGKIPGGTTVSVSSTTAFQVLSTGTTGNASTTVTAVPVAQCVFIVAGMAVQNVAGSGNTDIPANDYVVTGCTGSPGSFVMANASGATGHAGVALAFTPGVVMTANSTGDTTEEGLRFNANSITESVACDIVASGALKPTAITPFTLVPATNAPTSDSTASSAALTEGYLRNCVISVTAGTPLDGTTHVHLDISRGATTQRILTQGDVTAAHSVTFPSTDKQKSLGETCHQRMDAFPAPAAGVAWTYTPVAGETTELQQGGVLYQASTTLQDRVVAITITPREGVAPWTAQVGGSSSSYWPAGMRGFLIFSETNYPSLPNLGALTALSTTIPVMRVEGGGAGQFSVSGAGFTAGQVSAMPTGDQITEFQGMFLPCLANY